MIGTRSRWQWTTVVEVLLVVATIAALLVSLIWPWLEPKVSRMDAAAWAAWVQAVASTVAIGVAGYFAVWQTQKQQAHAQRQRTKADISKMLAFHAIAGGASVAMSRALMLIKPMNLANARNIEVSLRGSDISDIRTYISRLQAFPRFDFLEPIAVVLSSWIIDRCLECDRDIAAAISGAGHLYNAPVWGPDEQFRPLLEKVTEFHRLMTELITFVRQYASKGGVAMPAGF